MGGTPVDPVTLDPGPVSSSKQAPPTLSGARGPRPPPLHASALYVVAAIRKATCASPHLALFAFGNVHRNLCFPFHRAGGGQFDVGGRKQGVPGESDGGAELPVFSERKMAFVNYCC